MTHVRSLRSAILLNFLVPVFLLALGISGLGYLVITNVVESTHDRLLDGSLMAIAERLALEDGEVTVDMPQTALGMLESKAQDNVYYLVTSDGQPITGYPDLPLEGLAPLSEEPAHGDAVYRGNAVRVAAVSRRVYGVEKPIVVAVAETRMARDQLRGEMLRDLGLAQAILIIFIAVVSWFSVGRGLASLAGLSRQIDTRAVDDWRDLRPLDLNDVPREALAPATAMNALFERLRAATEMLRRFTADASHQMRTPLAIVRMHADLLRRLGADPEASRQALDEIDLGTARLERLITQLLSLARADEGLVGPVAREPIELGELIERVVAEQVVGMPRNVHLECDIANEPIIVETAFVLLSELIGNVLNNAIKYSGSDGRVLIRSWRTEDAAMIVVEDSGPGIPETERERVFQRFYRMQDSVSASGTGLGLAIVRAIATAIEVDVSLDRSQNLGGLSVSMRVSAKNP